MTLYELSQDYYTSAALLETRIEEKRDILKSKKLSHAEIQKMQIEICLLDDIWQDTKAIAVYLERYYLT